MQRAIKIQISDEEIIALLDAIDIYESFIERKIGNEIKAPYWARLQSIIKTKEKINKEINGL